METFKLLFRSFIAKLTRENPSDQGRKRRAEDLIGPPDNKLRCVEGSSFFVRNCDDDTHHYPSGVDLSCKSHGRWNAVKVSKWGLNGKENGLQRLFNDTPMELNHQQAKDNGDEVQIVEEQVRCNLSNKKVRKSFKMGSTLTPVNVATVDDDVEVVELSPPPKTKNVGKEVEVIKILQSPQINRIDNEIQILKERPSTSRENEGHRGPSNVRKPFKAINPPVNACASSTPIGFSSKLVQSPEPEIEVLDSSTKLRSSMPNGVGASPFRSHHSSHSESDSIRDRNSTLRDLKRLADFDVYNKIFFKSAGVERPFPCTIKPSSGSNSTPTHKSGCESHNSVRATKYHTLHSQASYSNLTPLLRKPVDRIDFQHAERIVVPVERKNESEPSTSAARQLRDDTDVQVLGHIEHPKTTTNPELDTYLHEILAKYKEKERQRCEQVEEYRKMSKLYEERNRQLSLVERQKLIDEVTDQLFASNLKYLQIVEEEPEEEDEKVPPLPVLTQDMEAEIDKALKSHPDAVLANGFNLMIKGRDIHTLRPLAWLNDEVINFYMNLIIERGKKDNFPAVYAFNTFFFPKLVGSGYDSLKRWTKKVDIFAHDVLLVPVHRGMHWCMAIIDMKEKVIRYYDSMNGRFPQCMDALLNYLQKESLDKKKQQFDTSGWRKEHAEDIPQQENGSDCGMFACMYAEYISRGAPITFTQDNMIYFRRKAVYEILKGRLLC